MKRLIKSLIPQVAINRVYHLPLAVRANVKYGFPGKKLRVIGVTGTDGKTTTVNMIYQILKAAGKKVSMISTISAVIAGKSFDTGFHVTSPDPQLLQKFLKKSADFGDEFMVLEVTSHALDQFRVWGIPFEVGVVTNVTHEHLDYHKTFANYLATKAKLIEKAKFAVLNFDDPSFGYLKKNVQAKLVTFGLTSKALVNPQKYPVKLNLLGQYNLKNAMAALAAAVTLGIDKKVATNALAKLTALSGRMEKITNRRGLNIVVDFAHTPNALEESLKTLRRKKTGRLIAVFGCASQRDTEKRPMMGAVAAKLADITILTDEDPRFEDPMKIINEIAQGGSGFRQGVNLYKQHDRKKAIKLALELAKAGDTIGIFGKGHETSMSYKGVEKPWSDKKVVQELLSKRA